MEQVRRQKGMVLGLDSMRCLMAQLGNPQEKVQYIQIAGTNGKGSTAACLANILMEAGIAVGRYTSPAVYSFADPYWVRGELITEEEFALGVTEVAAAAAELEGVCAPTVFELETALAFWYFARKGCELVILETGLGGDMDATNIVNTTVCSILTSISMDHGAVLGKRISEIAAHKAGIIKAGVPVVCLEQEPSAMEVIRRRAQELSAPLYEVKRDEARLVFANKKGAVLFYRNYENLQLRMLGTYQQENAALAIQAADVLRESWPITEAAIRRGLEETSWKGRFELFAGNPDIILDGAHNPDGARRLRETVNRFYGQEPVTYVMGVLADKDYDKEISVLLGRAARVYTVTPPSPRAMDKEDLRLAIRSRFPQLSAAAAESIEEAMEQAVSMGDTVVVCGTLTILGAADRWIQQNRPREVFVQDSDKAVK